MDKETYRFMYPAGIASLSLVFSQKALQWLYGTTRDDDGRETVKFILFGDLLAPEKARVSAGCSCFPQVWRSIPKNYLLHSGTWAGSAYATCLPYFRTWGLSLPTVQGWHP